MQLGSSRAWCVAAIKECRHQWQAKIIRASIAQLGFHRDTLLPNLLVAMYGKMGDLASACAIFQTIHARNVVSWTIMAAAFAANARFRDAVLCFRWMELGGVRPDKHAFTTIVEACTDGALGHLQMAKSFHSRILASGIRVSVITGTALVTTYRKCGALGLARSTFDGIAGKSILCWNTMISAYAQHGHAMEALKLFNALKQAGERPNSITFVSAIAACGHVGRLDDAVYNLSSMIADYRITPSSEHLGCMIDLLGRAGRLEEAERMVDKISPDDAAERIMQWKALLAACKVHGDFKRGGRVARKLLELHPGSDAPYVLLFNLYVDREENPG
ncbi:hypothetical protein SELMODRAFT_126411 [Selaginella moellendorffii]|uniref:Pentacotripeptide-repeat region of PRORP domain-containing protein n=1 Tax=Selaginella moellendorffii TaxID=88036 RepID=D8SWD3_SELML|nr:hypothetical protein SELMODRAFT_126411 [Selaginella moellendorffii]